MFNSNLVLLCVNSRILNFFFQKSNFCISLPVLVIYFKLFGCYLQVFFFFLLFVLSHKSRVGAKLMVWRFLWYNALFALVKIGTPLHLFDLGLEYIFWLWETWLE